MHFTDLQLSQPILRALQHEGYSTPTPIQHQAIPHILAGRDLLGCAQTGTGKTAAFALPILHHLSTAPVDKSRRGPRHARALVLSPTRELAEQIRDSFDTYGRDSHLETVVIYGGVSQLHQERALRRGVDIIVATPGRLLDLMDQRLVDLRQLQVLVLDEADRMLDMGFIHPIQRIAAATPPARQTLLFSATMPASILKLAGSLLRDPIKVAVTPVSSAAPAIDQAVYMIGRDAKQSLLEHLLQAHRAQRTLIFTKTKHGAERLGRRLAQAGHMVETIHGNKSQPQRRRALARFSTGQAHILVATDVAARGLDVDDITHVFNFDLPMEPEAYVHRIGRTGRAGAVGVALSFCDPQERGLLRDIERLTGRKLTIRVAEGFVPAPIARHDAAPAHEHARPRPHAHAHAHAKSRAPAHRPAAAAAASSAPAHPRQPMHGWRKPTRRRTAR